jgi:hypothetical protein
VEAGPLRLGWTAGHTMRLMSTAVTPRVFDLLAEARRALALRGRLLAAGKDASAVEEALEGLYRDLGRAVVHSAEASDGLVFPTIRRLESTDYELDEDEEDDDWYTDEDEPLGPRAAISEPLFEPRERDDPTDVPVSDSDDSTPVLPFDREFTDGDDPLPGFEVATLASLSEASRREDSPLSRLLAVPTAPWKSQLAELLALLALPPADARVDDLRVELSRLQWATTDVGARLGGLPSELQLVFVGLLGARAQALRALLDNDVAPRIVIDRLQRYRIEADLPSVAALLPTARPESGSWQEDTRGWWGLLRPPH